MLKIYNPEDLEKIELLYNHVLVTCQLMNDHVMLAGNELLIDNTFEPDKHRSTKGEVVKVSPLTTKDYEMKARVGDEVHFHYLTLKGCDRDGRTFVVRGEEAASAKVYYIIPYPYLYCAVRENEIEMLNGWLLAEAIMQDEQERFGIKINTLAAARKEHLSDQGIVRFIGEPEAGSVQQVNVGDHVFFTNDSDIPLEYDLHNSLGRRFFRMKQSDIMLNLGPIKLTEVDLTNVVSG